jgi:hypothetical protein
VLLECEGDALDLSGDMGAVGRFSVCQGQAKDDEELLLDLKGKNGMQPLISCFLNAQLLSNLVGNWKISRPYEGVLKVDCRLGFPCMLFPSYPRNCLLITLVEICITSIFYEIWEWMDMQVSSTRQRLWPPTPFFWYGLSPLPSESVCSTICICCLYTHKCSTVPSLKVARE